MFDKTTHKIKQLISKHIFNGAVIKITQYNKTIMDQTFGYNNKATNQLMQKNNIFSIYSMTKPIVVFAFLMLVERQKITLDTPLAKFYSKFDARITMRNLLTMTSGITYFWNNTPASKAAKQLVDAMERENFSLQVFCEKMSDIKWDYAPNTIWHYGLNIDLLGGIIEQLTKQSLAQFLQTEIFEPLEMHDTAFYTKDMQRYTTVYDFYASDGKNILKEHKNWHWIMPFVDRQPHASLGGSGLFSTTDDYAKFLNVLLTGTHRTHRFVSMQTLQAMRSDQLGALKQSFRWTLNKDYSYGYGVRVRVENNQLPLTEIGEFGWDGALGSAALVDPKNHITMTFMASSFPGNNRLIATELFGAVYEDLRAQKLIN